MARFSLVRERRSEGEAWINQVIVQNVQGRREARRALLAAVVDYLYSAEGISSVLDTESDFNWGDALMDVPDDIWRMHGVSFVNRKQVSLDTYNQHAASTILVNQDEHLTPLNYLDHLNLPEHLARLDGSGAQIDQFRTHLATKHMPEIIASDVAELEQRNDSYFRV